MDYKDEMVGRFTNTICWYNYKNLEQISATYLI